MEEKEKELKKPDYLTLFLLLVFCVCVFVFARMWIVSNRPTEQNRFFHQVFTEHMPGLFKDVELDKAAEFSVEIEYFDKFKAQITPEQVKDYPGTVRVNVEIMSGRYDKISIVGMKSFRFAAMYEMDIETRIKLAEAEVVYAVISKNGVLEIKKKITNYTCPDYTGKTTVSEPNTGKATDKIFKYLADKGLVETKGDST